MFNADQKTVGVFCVVVFLLFVFLVVYHIVVFGFARREYAKAGGLKAAKKEASGQAVKSMTHYPFHDILFSVSGESRLGKNSSESFCIILCTCKEYTYYNIFVFSQLASRVAEFPCIFKQLHPRRR